jgi:hypothetical protein
MINFSPNAQNVTLTANVTSSAGTVNEGAVTFTIMQGSTVIGTATAASVHNGVANVNYVLPGGTLPGAYTLDADYSDPAGNFIASSGTASLGVNAVVTSLQLTGVAIVPNLANGTAQLTLTAQLSNPTGIVNEGVVTFTLAGVSTQGVVQNGTASVQLVVPLADLTHNLVVQLAIQSAYADNSTFARFGPGSITTPIVLPLFNALMPSRVTLTPDGREVDTVPLLLAPLEFFYANQQWTEFRFGPIDLHVGFANVGNLTVVTLNGMPWQVLFFGPQHQLLGVVTLFLNDDSGLALLLSGALDQIVGVEPA